MKELDRPLILVHGLWDNPKIFDKLINSLEQPGDKIFTPSLPHKLGRKSIEEIALDLNQQILKRYGSSLLVDILGFSMGGLIARFWLQEFEGFKRTKRFFSLGSPQKGTLTAQLVPSFLFRGISDMKLGSSLLNRLNNNEDKLKSLNCLSFYSSWDLMVFPGWQAVLPCGRSSSLPVLTHKGLLINTKSIDYLVISILTS